MRKKKLLFTAAAFAVLLFCFSCLTACSKLPDVSVPDNVPEELPSVQEPEIPHSDCAETETIKEPEPEPETVLEPEPETEPGTEPVIIEQPELITDSLDVFGLTPEDLDCDQLVVVTASGTSARVSCFDNLDGQWTANSTLEDLPGFVGRNGVSDSHTEGDNTTPRGLYSFGIAFGNRENPGTTVAYKDVNEYDYWVDDPESPYYNRLVDSREIHDWNHGEHLSAYTQSYAYCVFIQYNYPETIPYKGCAIFLHCGNAPTSGCVSVSENDMIEILRWLRPGGKILIV